MYRLTSTIAIAVAAGFIFAAANAQPKGDLAKAKGKAGTAPAWTQSAEAQKPPFPWVDVHVHLTAPSAQGLIKMANTAVAEMARYGVGKFIIMPTPFAGFEYREFVEATRKLPAGLGFLGGSNILNPIIQETKPGGVTDAVRQRFVALAEQVLKDGARGFGEIAALHFSLAPGHKLMHVPPDHPLFLALAEVAGSRGVVIDLHLDPIVGTMPLAEGLKSPPNPKSIPDNVEAFQRLLAHDRKAKIVWAHGGMDPFGAMTPELVGRLMDGHPNLYMNLRVAPPLLETVPVLGLRIKNKLVDARGLNPVWLAVLRKHADRFVLGTDRFFVIEGGTSPVTAFVAGNETKLLATNLFLSLLPRDLARKIAIENANRLYSLQ
ncbi:MAG TPA: amidohydrolase family protein [Xanthobacteraceae bacterium]|jgi:hypothetical protein